MNRDTIDVLIAGRGQRPEQRLVLDRQQTIDGRLQMKVRGVAERAKTTGARHHLQEGVGRDWVAIWVLDDELTARCPAPRQPARYRSVRPAPARRSSSSAGTPWVACRWDSAGRVESAVEVTGVGAIAHGLGVGEPTAAERNHVVAIDDEVAFLILDLTRALHQQRPVGANVDGYIGHGVDPFRRAIPARELGHFLALRRVLPGGSIRPEQWPS